MDKGFSVENLEKLLKEIDENEDFDINNIIVFWYNFESIKMREIQEAIKNYLNKKDSEIDFTIRY